MKNRVRVLVRKAPVAEYGLQSWKRKVRFDFMGALNVNVLVVAIGETIVMKLSAVSFEQVAKPIWRTVRTMGLSGEELDRLIEEAKTQTRSGR